MTLDEVARACVPPTTAQTIGRLEMGTRTVSVAWLNRIAAALDVEAADLVGLPDRPRVPVAATLGANGAHAPQRSMTIAPPTPEGGTVAIVVVASIGDYRAGDQIWCVPLTPDAFGRAMNRDVLVPRPGGRFVFARLIGHEAGARLHLLPPGPGARQQVVADPPWIGLATRLVRTL